VFGQLREVNAVEPLVADLHDEDEDEREAAKDSLESIGDP
jgi:HEAT repeat protein